MPATGVLASLAACLPATGASAGLDVLKGAQEMPLGLHSVFSQATKDGGAGASFVSVLAEVVIFCIAFAAIRAVLSPKKNKKGKLTRSQKKVCEAEAAPPASRRRDAAPEALPLRAWRRTASRGPVSGQDLQAYAVSLLAEEPAAFIDELIGHLAKHRGIPEHNCAVDLLLDVPAKAGRPDLIEALSDASSGRLDAEASSSCMRQALLSAFAVNGQTDEVEKLLAQERSEADDQKIAMQSLAAVVRGYLKCGKLRQAVDKLEELRRDGNQVPAGAISELAHAACKHGADLMEVLTWLDGKAELPSEVVAVMLEHCAHSDDLKTAKKIQAVAQEKNIQLSEGAFESLLKLHSKVSDSSGAEVLASMLAASFTPSEGLCRHIMARCSEPRNVQLAEALADFLRARKEMTFATFKTLMKVYAYAGLYDKACDLYIELKAMGMEPDSVMNGSVLKFAAKAGRTALSQEVFDKTDGGCVQNYMWLIRAAGQEGDVDEAVNVFRKLQQKQPNLVDTMAFNIIIDTCASKKDMQRARELLSEMQRANLTNLVTYNTLMKGYMALGDLKAAKGIKAEMEASGIFPDSTSFSCLLSGCLKLGNFRDAWGVIEEMTQCGLAPDTYMVAVMMQAAKKAQNPRDADRLLAILDRPNVAICDDEVAFNTVLDACIHRRDRRRLAWTLDEYERSKLQPSVRTFGLLIKACSMLKRTKRCWDLWQQMVDDRGMLPNDVTLGCMIDALVEGQQVDEALALFQEWKTKVKCDTIIYSTLIKGFSNLGDAERAMALYKDMKLDDVQMNHIVYTALINAHTRNGLMKRAEALLEDMKREGCQPNAITYSSLVKGHCVQGDLQAALSLFHQMMDLGFEADAVIFNTLLDGCVQIRNWALGDELLTEMQRLNVQQSNFTLSILVKMWSKRGELEKAFQCVYSALAEPMGHKLVDAQVGACIVGACIHNRSPVRALEVFEDMKNWRHFDGPDVNTYSALISGLPRLGYVRRAAQLAEEACSTLYGTASCQDRRPLAHSALQQLFKSLRQEGLLCELGYPLEGKLRRAGMKVDWQWLA